MGAFRPLLLPKFADKKIVLLETFGSSGVLGACRIQATGQAKGSRPGLGEAVSQPPWQIREALGDSSVWTRF